MSFEIWTVIVVLAIFALFAVGAHRADQVVAAKAQARRREAQSKLAPNNKKK